MLALVSPAKKLDFGADAPLEMFTQPMFQGQSQALIDVLRAMPKSRLKALMGLSDNLTDLNYERYQNYQTPFDLSNAKQAVYAFRGDTYVGLDVDSLSAEDVGYAQEHLGILSGLYGVLRPLDLIQPYRLEMGTGLATSEGENLYDFWGAQLAQKIEAMVSDHKDKTVICLASNEYIKAVPVKALGVPFVTCHFKEVKNGTPKTVGIFAKRARGMMARFMIKNKVETPEGLKDFDIDGYGYESTLSDDKNLVFIRNS
ncbi:MAG: peroxide stress protein YaaA [Bdellovibrionales bacterium]